MSETLFHLVYYSRNRLPGDDAEVAAAIEQILQTSRANNDAVGVSGALMFNGGCFAQVLEGPEAAIESTFERIQQDDRHGDVSVLSFGSIDKRSFDRWSMAFVGSSAVNANRYAHIGGASGFDPSKMTSSHLHATLHGLVLEEEQTTDLYKAR